MPQITALRLVLSGQVQNEPVEKGALQGKVRWRRRWGGSCPGVQASFVQDPGSAGQGTPAMALCQACQGLGCRVVLPIVPGGVETSTPYP